MDKEIVDKALDLTKDLATKVGQTVEQLWPHAARYIAIEAIGNAFAWVLCCVAVVLVRFEIMKAMKEGNADTENVSIVRGMSAIVTGVIVCLIVCDGLVVEIPKIVEPVGYLVKEAVVRASSK